MKQKMLKGLILSCLIAATAMQAATWKYAMGEGLNDPQGLYATHFKSYIEENSKNKIQLYAVGALGEETDMMEQVQAGLLQFLGQSAGYMGGTIPEMDVFFVPYLLPTDVKELDTFFKNSKVINKMLPAIVRKHDLELLSIYPEGEFGTTTFKEFHSPADLKGMKMRVMPGSPLLVETWAAFGASPVPMTWGETIGALKTNMIDGEENPVIWIAAYGLDKLSNVLTYTGHGHFIGTAIANKKFFDNLSTKNKKLVKDAATSAQKYILKKAQDLDALGLGRIIRSNPDYKIVTLTAAERAPFIKRSESVQESFGKISSSNKAIVDQMKKDLAAAAE
jgi:TRAP-type C4-dicarboxylate transport system substrate-binding protein